MKESVSIYSKQKNLTKKVLKDNGFENIEISNNYYYFSGFATKNEKIIYFSSGDVRLNKNNLLIRTATSYKDFTGGCNNFCTFENEEIRKLACALTVNF